MQVPNSFSPDTSGFLQRSRPDRSSQLQDDRFAGELRREVQRNADARRRVRIDEAAEDEAKRRADKTEDEREVDWTDRAAVGGEATRDQAELSPADGSLDGGNAREAEGDASLGGDQSTQPQGRPGGNAADEPAARSESTPSSPLGSDPHGVGPESRGAGEGATGTSSGDTTRTSPGAAAGVDSSQPGATGTQASAQAADDQSGATGAQEGPAAQASTTRAPDGALEPDTELRGAQSEGAALTTKPETANDDPRALRSLAQASGAAQPPSVAGAIAGAAPPEAFGVHPQGPGSLGVGAGTTEGLASGNPQQAVGSALAAGEQHPSSGAGSNPSGNGDSSAAPREGGAAELASAGKSDATTQDLSAAAFAESEGAAEELAPSSDNATPLAHLESRDESPSTSRVRSSQGAAFDESLPVPEDPDAVRILHQFRTHLAGDTREATLNLVPAHLGRMAIRLRMKGGRLEAQMRVESAETMQTLERNLPELRASLAQEGIEADDFTLELGFQDDAQSSGKERRSAGREAFQMPGSSHRMAAVAVDVPNAPAPQPRTITDSSIDTLA